MARGAFPDYHPLCLGMPGMHGNYAAVTAMQKCDLLISLGARFDDRVTGKLSTFAPDAKIIHADIDPAEIGKNRPVDVPIVGDAKAVLAELAKAVAARRSPQTARSTCRHGSRRSRRGARSTRSLYDQPEDGPIKPQFVVDRFAAATEGDAVVVTGVGQHQMWASQLMPCNKPNSFVTSGGLGTMGFGVPAAFGAKVGRPDERVVCIDGDGCFQMTAQELATATIEKIPFTVAILNNSHLGMVRQWQELFYDERYSEVHLPQVPDYVKLAEAYGGVGLRATTPDEVDDVIDKALGIDDRPCVIDFRVDRRARCASRWFRPERRTTTSSSARPAGRLRPTAMVRTRLRRMGPRAHTRSRSWSRTSRACWPGSRACSPGAASTSIRWPSARPRIPRSRA